MLLFDADQKSAEVALHPEIEAISQLSAFGHASGHWAKQQLAAGLLELRMNRAAFNQAGDSSCRNGAHPSTEIHWYMD